MKQQNRLFRQREVSVGLALIPLAVLVAMLALVIKVFGADAIEGGSQIALLVASSVSALIAVVVCRCKWSVLEEAVVGNIHTRKHRPRLQLHSLRMMIYVTHTSQFRYSTAPARSQRLYPQHSPSQARYEEA